MQISDISVTSPCSEVTDLGQDVEDHHVVATAVQAETGNYQKFTNHQSVRHYFIGFDSMIGITPSN